MSPLPDPNHLAVLVFDRHAIQYQQKFMDVTMYAAELDLFCKDLPQGAKVLELACGPGNITKYLLDKRPDLKIYGSDLAPSMVGLARQNNPSATFEVKDCRAISELDGGYHGVVCSFCLPYLDKQETNKLIHDCHKLLAESGILYISFIEGKHSNSGLQRTTAGNELYMYYYEEEDLLEVLKNQGFELLHAVRKESPPTATVVSMDWVMVARKR